MLGMLTSGILGLSAIINWTRKIVDFASELHIHTHRCMANINFINIQTSWGLQVMCALNLYIFLIKKKLKTAKKRV